MSQLNPQTLRTLAGASTPTPSLTDAALIVIDAQHEYADGGSLCLEGLGPAASNIAALQSAARARQSLVVHVAHAGATGGLFDPAAGGRLLDLTGPEPGEQIVSKTLPNSFAKTDLHKILSSAGITNLVLVGFMTHMCVSSTARAALDLGYATTVVSDACATRDLPGPTGGDAIPADRVHQVALAALADRFSEVVPTASFGVSQVV